MAYLGREKKPFMQTHQKEYNGVFLDPGVAKCQENEANTVGEAIRALS